MYQKSANFCIFASKIVNFWNEKALLTDILTKKAPVNVSEHTWFGCLSKQNITFYSKNLCTKNLIYQLLKFFESKRIL